MSNNKLFSGRLESLDSIRGIAAFGVVFVHLAGVYLDSSVPDFANIERIIKLIYLSPLAVLFNGASGITMFFLLSGFVLTLMLERGMRYPEYIIRRTTRLYIPYIVSIAFAVTSIALFGSHKIPELSERVNEFLGVHITFRNVLDHILFIGRFDPNTFNFPIWSMVMEMRYSIIFPLILAVVIRYGWRLTTACAFVISLASNLPSHPTTTLWLVFFVVGCNLAVNRETLMAWYSRQSQAALAGLWVFAVAAYVFPPRIDNLTGLDTKGYWLLLCLPGVSFFLVAALSSPNFAKFLSWAPFRFLGKISYSLYLYHGVILVAALTLFFGKVPTWLMLTGIFITSLCVGTLAYYAIEIPSIKCGAAAVKLLKKRTAPSEKIPAQPG